MFRLVEAMKISGGDISTRPATVAPSARLVGLMRKIFSYPVALASGIVAITVLTLSGRFDNPDLWWHLKIGELIWNTHRIPASDPFSFTAAGQPWIVHEWLSELSMYGAYRLGGYPGLLIWASVCASAIFLIVYLMCWLLTRNALVSFRNAMVAWCFGTVGLCIRPLLLGHMCMAAEILILELARTRDRRWLWLLPPVFAVWVNCHASFPFGFVLLGVYFIASLISFEGGLVFSEAWDPRTRRLMAWMIVMCAAAACANPIGPKLLLYPLDTLFHQGTNLAFVEEWLPPDLRQANTLAMVAIVPAILLLSMIRKSPISVRELLLVAVVSGLALTHRRMLFLFGIVISTVLCRFAWGGEHKRTYPWANGAIAFGCLAIILWFFPGQAALQRQIDQANPVGAVNFIRRSHLSGPMLNEYAFGGYLIWSLPATQVFIDGRADMYYPGGIMADYMRWATLDEDPVLLLDRKHINFCLLYEGSAIAKVMPYLPGWQKIYNDGAAVIFARTRDSGLSKALIPGNSRPSPPQKPEKPPAV